MNERRQSTFAEFDARVRSFQDELSRRSVQSEPLVRNTRPSKGVGRYSGRVYTHPNFGPMRVAQA